MGFSSVSLMAGRFLTVLTSTAGGVGSGLDGGFVPVGRRSRRSDLGKKVPGVFNSLTGLEGRGFCHQERH